jgi:hypothetical protein
LLPGGTPLTVRLTAPVSSGSSHVDDDIQFKAVDDVVIDGWIVIPKDAVGEGVVSSVDPAGTHGHSGQIGITFKWIYGADGLKVRLSEVPSKDTEGDLKGTSATATVLSTVLLGPVGLFAHNFVRGKDVTIDTSKKISLYIADTVHITAKAKAPTSDGFAH